MIDANWQARLLQIAAEHPDAPGEAGDRLRATVARHTAHEFTRDLHLAHSRVRESLVTGVHHSLRCGALLMKVPPDELAGLLRATGIDPQPAQNYLHLAQQATREQRQRCLRRRGRISEAEALALLLLNNQEFQP